MIEGWDAFVREAGPLLADELSAQAPRGGAEDEASGTLANSMTWRDNAGVLEVGSTDSRASEYGGLARLVARGTGPHPIDPIPPGQFLHFFVDGDEVFARHVDHPGTAPNPFHLRAWEAKKREVLTIFKRTVPHAVLAQLNPWRNRTI